MKVVSAPRPSAPVPARETPSVSPELARFDRDADTFYYTQDGVQRSQTLRKPVQLAAVAGAGTSALLVAPLALAAQRSGLALSAALGAGAGASLLAGAAVGWLTHALAEKSNANILGEAERHGFCKTYEQFSETPLNRDFNQSQLAQELVEKLDPKLVSLHFTEDISVLDGKIPSTRELQAEFDVLAKLPGIPFEFIEDGCYSRAHLMCEQMVKDGFNNAKMFVSVKNEKQPDQLLSAGNAVMNVNWVYHVAPLVVARDDSGQVGLYIMDPSMADHPLKADEWIGKMWDKKDEIYVDITRRAHYEPEPEHLQFQDWLGDSHKTMRDYSAKLEDIKKNGYHPERAASAPGFWQRLGLKG